MALIPRIANLANTIPLPVGTGAGIQLLTGYEQWWGQGYGPVQTGINTDGVVGLESALSGLMAGNTSQIFVSEILYGSGPSTNYGGYNNGCFVYMLDPASNIFGDGLHDFRMAFYPQTPTSGIQDNGGNPVPNQSNAASVQDMSTYIVVSGAQGITNLPGLSAIALMTVSGSGDIVAAISDFVTVDIFNAFQLEPGEADPPGNFLRTPRWIFTDPDFWLLYTNATDGTLTLVNFTLQAFGGGFADTKYSITFDDADFNNAIISGDYELAGINDQGFMIVFLNQVGAYAQRRIIHMAFDGLTYDEHSLSGDAGTEANIVNFGAGVGIDNSGQVFMMGIEGVSFLGSVFSPYVPLGAPIFTRNSQGVKLECSNYCIPFLKQRK